MLESAGFPDSPCVDNPLFCRILVRIQKPVRNGGTQRAGVSFPFIQYVLAVSTFRRWVKTDSEVQIGRGEGTLAQECRLFSGDADDAAGQAAGGGTVVDDQVGVEPDAGQRLCRAEGRLGAAEVGAGDPEQSAARGQQLAAEEVGGTLRGGRRSRAPA